MRSKGGSGPQAEEALAAKRADYFAAGTQVVWDVDLLAADVIRLYRAGSPLARSSSAAASRPTPSPPSRAGA